MISGEKGSAYTLITDKDKEFAPLLVRNLEGANQTPPPALLELANQVGACLVWNSGGCHPNCFGKKATTTKVVI